MIELHCVCNATTSMALILKFFSRLSTNWQQHYGSYQSTINLPLGQADHAAWTKGYEETIKASHDAARLEESTIIDLHSQPSISRRLVTRGVEAVFHQCKFLTCIFARFYQQLQKLRSLPPELYIKLDSSSCVNTEEMGNQASDFRVECKCRSNSLLESPCLYLVACLVRDGSKNNYSETQHSIRVRQRTRGWESGRG